LADTTVYTTGGTVQAGGGVYLARKADDDLLERCREGQFAFVLTARQMGKSSLMTRTAERLAGQGVRSVIIDLNALGTQLDAERWYLGLLAEVESQLGLKARVTDWWRQREHLGVTHRLSRFFDEVLLREVPERLVLFVDEIDTTLSLGFTDDFFATIRSLHNMRAQRQEMKRLSFVLLGVATPGDLIKDAARTPFNLGHRVELTDFTFEEALPLAAGLGLPEEQAKEVLRWALQWTGGHPYLTQRLCWEITQQKPEPTREGIDRVVARIFLGERSFQDHNLQFIRDMLTKPERAPDVGEVLRTYRQVRRGRQRVPDEEQSRVKSHLKLSGAVRRERDALVVRNSLYREIFDDRWVGKNLPFSWKRFAQRVALPLAVTAFVLLVPFTVLLQLQVTKARDDVVRGRALKHLLESQFVAQTPGGGPLSVLLAAESMRWAKPGGAGLVVRNALPLRRPLVDFLHEGPIYDVAFSPDGKLIATSSLDNTARIWDAASGKVLVQLKHGARVVALTFSPDGKRLATASYDDKARVWNVSSSQEPVALPLGGRGYDVVFSPDGKWLATAGQDGYARVWDADSGQELQHRAHTDAVNRVAFSPDGKWLATASQDGSACVLEAASGKELACFRHDGPVRSVTFKPDGKALATSSDDNSARVWDLATGKPLVRLAHEGDVMVVAYSPDGKTLATASADKTARLWDATSGNPLARFELGGQVSDVVFSPDGRVLATASWDDTVRLWDVASGSQLSRLVLEAPVWTVTFSPDGRAFAASSDYNVAHEWSMSVGGQPGLLPHAAQVRALAFSPDGQILATAGDEKAAHLWEAATGRELARFDHGGAIGAVAFSPDGKLVVTAGDDSTAQLWDVASRRSLVRLEHEDTVGAVAFSPDGKLVATAGDDNVARLWDAATGQGIASFSHRAPVRAVAFSPDGQILATASQAGTASWDVASGKLRDGLNEAGAFNAVAFSPDGKTLVTAGQDGTARSWEVASSRVRARFAHGGPVQAVAFSPDGRVLATASDDRTARLWDLGTGKQLALLEHQGRVSMVVFSRDGKTLATASDDKAARVWDSATGTLLARIPHDGRVNAVAFSLDGKVLATSSADQTAFLTPWRSEDLLTAACFLVNRNMTAEEWAYYFEGDEPYHRTCSNLPCRSCRLLQLDGRHLLLRHLVLHRLEELVPAARLESRHDVCVPDVLEDGVVRYGDIHHLPLPLLLGHPALKLELLLLQWVVDLHHGVDDGLPLLHPGSGVNDAGHVLEVLPQLGEGDLREQLLKVLGELLLLFGSRLGPVLAGEVLPLLLGGEELHRFEVPLLTEVADEALQGLHLGEGIRIFPRLGGAGEHQRERYPECPGHPGFSTSMQTWVASRRSTRSFGRRSGLRIECPVSTSRQPRGRGAGHDLPSLDGGWSEWASVRMTGQGSGPPTSW